MDEVQVRTSPAAAEPVGASAWPLVGALGGVLLVIGVITDARWFIAGIVVIIVVIAEWMILAWSERASADQAYNAEVRERVLHPVELPIAGAVVLVVIIFGFSRMMLALPRDAGPALFVVAAGLIAAFGAILAKRSSVRKGVVAGICAVGIVAVLAGGIASAVTGERDELTEAEEEDHFGERSCSAELDEHTDHKTSGAVAAKANILAEFTLRDDDTLELKQIAGSLPGTVLTIDRSNTVNVLFTNETEEERRLRIYGGTVETDVNGTPVSEVTEFCTQAIGKGDTQTPHLRAVAAVRVRRRSVLRRGSRRRGCSHRDRGAVIHQEPLTNAPVHMASVDHVPTDSGEQMPIRPRPARRRRIALTAAPGWVCSSPAAPRTRRRTPGSRPGPNAQTIDNLQRPVFLAAGVVGVLVFAAVVYCIVRFRDRGQAMPSQSHGKSAVEIGGIVLSASILAAIAVPTFRTIFDLADTSDCDLTVNVTGQQWWWEYAYPAQEGTRGADRHLGRARHPDRTVRAAPDHQP